MKLSQDGWLGIGILLALVVVTSLAVVQQTGRDTIPFLSSSPAPDGTLALKLWLDELGYRPTESSQAIFRPDASITTIFILQPLEVISEDEWRLIDKWVEQGGVLVLAGDNMQTSIALHHFGYSMIRLREQAVEMLPVAPILSSPLLSVAVPTSSYLGISTSRTDFTTLMTVGDSAVMVSFEAGKGRVILSSTPYIFTNIALKEEAVAALVLNLIALTGQDGAVWFDEWHHGFQSEAIVGPWQWLRNTPVGHALLFVVGAVFLALLLQGRAFGRPIPLKHVLKRRGPLEHANAIANLNHKAGHSREVLRQYHHRLKRQLGQNYRLDPTIRDEEYVDRLARYNPSIDRDELLTLLRSLSREEISETELVRFASEAVRLMND